ncbi:MAG TPA: molybdopterin-guanine dinucleotide biosynthesis protein B [Acidobacteriota bacterium]|nr:molybdopterin-guanine dinucleotide biosynthesis protein B [Acidobacteriota bacterium]
MRTVSVVGFSGTGKTRLVVRLIEELRRRGLRVAAVKRCPHGFALDTEGKDTAEFSRAGADGVAMISPEGWAAVAPGAPAEAGRLASRLFPEADVVIIEGGKGASGAPKIEVLRAGVSDVLTNRPAELLAVVSDRPLAGGASIPVLGPDETARLADLILRVEEAAMADITLEVDGREIDLNAFVQTFIEKTVLGMVTALSGVDPEPQKITLVIEREDTACGPRRTA